MISALPASAHVARQRLLSLLLLVHGPVLILFHSLITLPPDPQELALERRSVRCVGHPTPGLQEDRIMRRVQATRAKSVSQSRRLRVRARDGQYLRVGDSCVSTGLGDGIYSASL
jgi:hypothetical protein